MRFGTVLTKALLLGLLAGQASAANITIDAHSLTMPKFLVASNSGLLDTASVQTLALDTGDYTFEGRDVNGVAFDFSVDASGNVQYASALAGFLSGAGTPNLVVLGYPISIDAHALTMPLFSLLFVSGNTTAGSIRNTSDLYQASVIPGTYTFQGVDVNGVTFDFSVDGSGKVQYPTALAGFLSGAGTPNLVVLGYPITIDARALTMPLYSLLFVSGSTTAGSILNTSDLYHPTVIPGSYTFQGIDVNGVTFNFSVDVQGRIQYAPAIAGFLSGANATTLVVLGYVITIDPRGLAATTPSFSVQFVTGTTTANSLASTLSVLPVTIIPGSYDFHEGHGGEGFDLFFTVDNPGFLQSLPTVFDMQTVTGNGTRVLRIGANSPPVVNAGGNLSILSSQQASTVMHGTATDPDGDSLTYRWVEFTPSGDVVLSGPAPVAGGNASLVLSTLPQLANGGHTLRLEASDLFGTSSDVIVLTVDDSPPVAAASGGGVFQDGSSVALSGHVSDFDGDPITYSWKVAETQEVLGAGMVIPPFGGNPIPVPGVVVSTTHLGVGVHTLQLTVSDGFHPAVVVPLDVTVIDTQRPTLAPTASTHILFPPNHQLVSVTIQANASDNSGCLTLSVDVKSSEKPDYDDCGHFVQDYQIVSVDQNTGVIHLLLRAERPGRGNGVTYTVKITATDCSGNKSTATLTILAPHDRGHD